MSASATDLPPAHRQRRAWLRWLVGLCLAVPLILAALVLDLAPRVAPSGPPDAAAATRVRNLAGRLHGLVVTSARDGRLTLSEAELDAALASLGRVIPGVTGQSRVTRRGIGIDLSVGPPLLPGPFWVNLHARIAPSQDGLRIDSLRVGHLRLPPGLAQAMLLRGLDWYVGDRFGTAAVAAVTEITLSPPRAALAFDFQGQTGSVFFERFRARLRAATGAPDDIERVYVHLWWLDRDSATGSLAGQGSALPWIRHAVESARAHPGAKSGTQPGAGSPAQEFRDSLFALALYCGDPEFGTAIGVGMSDNLIGDNNRCADVTLKGRVDLRRHFSLSAAIYALSTEQAVIGVGELKELLDSNGDGSGFSFDDMAANLSGARFAQAFLEAPAEDWPAMLASIRGEADILPSIEGLPSGLDAEEFRASYGDIDSPAYAAMLAEIHRRIDALPFYQPRAAAP